ncbi:MAG: hypothetical protein R3C61_07915 [Bacteroidia bacterium]
MQKHVLFFCLLLPGAISFAADNNNARRADPRLNARDLIHLEGDAKLRILDTYGREVARQTVSTQEGQWLWDTREMPDGIYLYELRTEAQEVLAQGKIVVLR